MRTNLLYKSLKSVSVAAVCLAALAVAGSPSSAQSSDDHTAFGNALPQNYSLINLDTPAIPAPRRGIYNIDLRAYGSAENQTYLGAEALYGLTPRLAAVLRLNGTYRRYYTSGSVQVPRGGREYEAALRYRLPVYAGFDTAVQGGIIIPDTPGRRNNSAYFAGEFIASRGLGDGRTTVYFVPKILAGNETTVTLGGGVHYRFSDQFSVFGDIQGAVAGSNGFDINTGDRIRTEVWGVGVRYSPAAYGGRASLDLGVTNGLGRTTGFSSTSALSGSSAFFLNFSYRQ